MFRNYFFLYRCAAELDILLKEKNIVEAFTQEKDKLFFRIPLLNHPDHHLIFDCSPIINYVNSKEKHFKAKKNTVSFFNGFLPDIIKSVTIALNDRILIFNLSRSKIHFIIKGSATNVFILNNDSFSSFKKTDKPISESPLVHINKEEEIFNFLDSVDNKDLEWKTFSKKFPFTGKEIFLEAKAGSVSDAVEDFKSSLKNCITRVIYDKIIVYYDNNEGKPRFLPESFFCDKTETADLKSFDTYFTALNYYLFLKFKNAGEISIKTKIEKYIDSEIEKLSSKLNNLKFRIDDGSKEEEYRWFGNLLLMNLNKIQKGNGEIEVEDQNTGKSYKIKLDKTITPQRNIDRYFDKSRDEKINFDQSRELYKSALEKMDRLIKIKDEVNTGITQNELEIIFKRLKINQQNKANKMEDKCNYKHYLLHNKYHVFVGKDSRNNDELTTQFAKQNDLWFHARSVSGSHVVLRVDNTKEVVPKNIIKEVASLAAFYSKAKTSGVAPVSYTFKKYVHKKKGLEPGQVILSKENVILVKPEIPKECEPVISDLI